ncbi:hypothetical protein D3C85_905880 [compost metagenome]
MKKILLLLLFLNFSFINAQISFEKGYFISNNGTKTECFIKNLDWKNNPTEFKYKIEFSYSEFKTENIANVQEFGIDNDVTFKRFKIKIDRSSNDLKKITTNKNPVWNEETIFLKTLVKGDATLYSYSDENINRYFYDTKVVPTEQLIYVKYSQSDDNEGAIKLNENNEYKQQLFKNVSSANTSENDILKLSYKKSDLIKYFIKYNNIAPSTTGDKEAKINKGRFLVKITPAISMVSLTAKNEIATQNNVKLDNKVTFKFGGEAEYILPYNKNKWSIFINPSYQKYQDEKTYMIPSGFITNPETEANVKAKYTSIQVPIGVRHYIFLNATSKIFVNAAYAVDIASNTEINYTIISNNTKTDYKSKSGANFAFGLGYNFKNKLSAEIRLNTKKELMRDYSNYSAQYNAIDFILGYSIF